MFRIGIDDTDSPAGMCTTYLAAVLIRRLHRAGVRVIEARLVRLNPNVPEKTRAMPRYVSLPRDRCTRRSTLPAR